MSKTYPVLTREGLHEVELATLQDFEIVRNHWRAIRSFQKTRERAALLGLRCASVRTSDGRTLQLQTDARRLARTLSRLHIDVNVESLLWKDVDGN